MAEKRGKMGMVIFAVIALATLGGSFMGGRMLSGGGPADPAAEASHDGEGAAVAAPIDAGIFALQSRGGDEPFAVTVLVTPKDPGSPPDMQKMRDDVYKMLVSVSEMPAIVGDGLSTVRVERALMAIAPQEAPWISAVDVMEARPPQPVSEEPVPEETAH